MDCLDPIPFFNIIGSHDGRIDAFLILYYFEQGNLSLTYLSNIYIEMI